MKTNLKIFLIIAITMIAVNINAQIYSYKATEVQFTNLEENGEWSEWSEATKTDILIDCTNELNTIRINSADIQIYNKIKDLDDAISDDGTPIKQIQYLDKDGIKCIIMIFKISKTASLLQICYADFLILYTVESLH